MTFMNKNYIYILMCVAVSMALTSCGASYNIKGSTDVPNLDGQKFYLKTFKNEDMANLDSCDVLHGQFKFSGKTDSVALAYVTIEDAPLMPLLLEDGEIQVSLNSASQNVAGTPLNEKFTAFRKELDKIDGEIAELSRKQSQGIMNGENEDSLNMRLNIKFQELAVKKDSLITKFICNNFDTSLAAAAFQYVTIPILMQGGIPEKDDLIESIMIKASDEFKNDPYVKFYMDKAAYVEGVMNGTIELPDQQAPAQPMPEGAAAAPNADVPTPQELATPSDSAQ